MKKIVFAFLSMWIVAGCPGRSVRTPGGGTPPRIATVQGTFRLPAAAVPTSGRLVVWWERAGERGSAGHMSFALFTKLIPRYKVLSTGAFTKSELLLRWRVPAGGGITLHAVLDLGGLFWETVLGFGGGGNLIAHSPPTSFVAGKVTSVQLSFRRKSVSARPEYCVGGRYRLLHVDAPYVKGWMGNATRRRLCVVLPRSYATQPKRHYPVAFLLPGLGSTERSRLVGKGSLGAVADGLSADVILVGVDTRTVTGSTYFVDSAASGQWLRFAQAMVSAVDARFRTLPQASHRALMGQSTGGFNAVSLALRRPDLFGVVGASAPDALDLERWLLVRRGSHRYVKPRWLAWMRVEAALAPPDFRQSGQFLSYAADWSPGKTKRLPFRWPADLTSGRIRPRVWQRWQAQSPTRLLDDPARVRRIRAALGGRIFIAVGRHDEFDLYPAARAFSDKLRRLGIAHTFVAGPGGHGKGQNRRLRQALEFALRLWTPE